MSKRKRSDSIDAQIEASQRAETVIIEPPFELDAAQLKIFRDLIASKPRGDWSPDSIEVAGLLAVTTLRVRHLQLQVAKEGEVVVTETGTVKTSPLQAALEKNTASMLRMRSSLGLTASQRGHRPVKDASRVNSEMAIQQTAQAAPHQPETAPKPKPAPADDDGSIYPSRKARKLAEKLGLPAIACEPLNPDGSKKPYVTDTDGLGEWWRLDEDGNPTLLA